MIDSVLKGIGNSRFLKSAVPAGTSWADALAMLQAGTFPIDFNGINTEGFQQVGTPLNKANLLKDATAAQIGLPPSTTPDGMFQALGNTGELHVWRKTVVNASEKPAGYTLGSGTSLTLVKSTQRYGQGSTYWVPATSISVNDGGAINEITGSSVQVYYEKEESELKSAFWGKFIKFSSESDYGNVPDKDGVWFIPSSATIQKTTGGDYYYLTVVGAQKVNPYPLTPAGTTTTYPVSTNPNAYQEGDDAKAAGYVVGEVVKDEFVVGSNNNGSYNSYFDVSSSISVSDSGNVSLVSPTNLGFYSSSDANAMRGKFVRLTKYGATPGGGASWKLPDQIVYIPSDTVTNQKEISAINSSTIWVTIDRYQPVTGYPAIPADTTIEYLGKLGDKARVQMVSYVGTGTYGESNPNSLTFDFVPKIVIVQQQYDTTRHFFAIYGTECASTHYHYSYSVDVQWIGKTLQWHSYESYTQQLNEGGVTYLSIAIG